MLVVFSGPGDGSVLLPSVSGAGPALDYHFPSWKRKQGEGEGVVRM